MSTQSPAKRLRPTTTRINWRQLKQDVDRGLRAWRNSPLAIERSIYSGSDEIWTHADNVASWDSDVTDTSFRVEAYMGGVDGEITSPPLKLKAD